MLFYDIRIEKHSQVADEDTAKPGGADFATIEEHEAILTGWLEAAKLFGEMLVKIDREFARDFVFDYNGVAQEAANHRATQAILIRKLIPAHGGEAAFGDSLFPRRNIAIILRVSALNATDCGDAHAVEVCAGFGGVALKIAVQGTILLRNGELVAGFCEMVHADVQIAGVEKLEKARAEDLELLHAFGQVRGEGALLFLEPGHVSVAEESDAIGREAYDLIDGVCERFGG